MLLEKISVVIRVTRITKVTIAITCLIFSFGVVAQDRVVIVPLFGDESESESESEPATEKVIFITSGEFTGNLGGLEGADAICQAEADADGSVIQGKIFKAWLSTAIQDDDVFGPGGRQLNLFALPYNNTLDQEVFQSFTEFKSSPAIPIVHTAEQSELNLINRIDTWSNISVSLQLGTGFTCNAWTSESSTDRGATGFQIQLLFPPTLIINQALGAFGSEARPCNARHRLICVEQ